ncbi:hypothetical protein MH215_25260 [Paenibacillus sp. ACRSA]|uniref:hypothetical protein n=1 Tax=Paenibacillus sp. ACRSA TaxID=2918211 RepID=UPI001EF675EE|nr:hypothetical protein [Paenibacillus sp. ACRSA]MCG7380288.1 hypothetical protein [Paenibacillus sp. ACRSA]
MMKLLLVMFSVISPFSVQPAATTAAHDLPWTVLEEKTPEVNLAVDRSEPVEAFRTLNDISLEDNMHQMLYHKGQPMDIKEDPYLGCPEFAFQDVKVGLCEDTGEIQYIHIDASQERFKLNQQWIDMDIRSIQEVLGDPYVIAEDGEVYIRGDQALKVYLKSGTDQIEGIDLFDATLS